ncbi:hypothetical protein AQUCO_04200175v1 [Aquilegia coerulea]|uniref:CUE domain-containing protein n=1 Tax=Aquilegia coerulea TaxID=218851 RepID=A0A2G5CPJ6_AQUCA|nr:hypothetical protein AQUCO_04200175v1 [Aquilegia coerulea]
MSARSTHNNYRQKQQQQQDGNNNNSNSNRGAYAAGGGGFNRIHKQQQQQQRFVPKTTQTQQQQQRFVPKTTTPQTPSKQQQSITVSNLTTSLREQESNNVSTSSTSSRVTIGEDGNWISNRNNNNQVSGSGNGGNFVNYLPQDEAVANGLGVQDGALDPIQSQRVVDLLNTELARLLKLNPKHFWKQVASDISLHDFLDSFLQFRKRWYDFPHNGAKGVVAGVIVGELELSRRTFMVLYRISSNRDPGARASDSLSAKEHGALLQGKKLLDLPKLLDICAVYGHDNEELTRLLVTNAMQAQPILHENLSAVVSRFLSVVQTMHQRCDSMLENLSSSGGHEDQGDGRLHSDFLEVMDFINDAVASMDAFVGAYKPAALYFSCPVEMSYGSGELLSTLATLHDTLLPSLQKGFGQTNDGIQNSGGTPPDTATSLKVLSTRIIKFFWKLLDLCYLSNEIFEGAVPLPTSTKMFPSSVEDPVIRGDIVVHTFREINEEVARHLKGNKCTGTLLQRVQNNYNILDKLDELRGSGWIFMDADQFQYITLIVMPPEATDKGFNRSTSKENKVHMDENAAIIESKISQIKELFPDYGNGFLGACLEAYNQNPEEVIQRILEGTLHEELQSMDIKLDKIPAPKSALTTSRNDKGKGLLQPSIIRNDNGKAVSQITSPSKVVSTSSERQTEGPSSSSSSLVGRFTRKTRVDLPNPKTLDSRGNNDSAKTSLLASHYEYEDEYDDSFDDLGLSVAESGYEEAETLGERFKSAAPGSSWGSETESHGPNKSGPKWNSRKTPQFYVKDGKNYSYKVAGSVAVADSREAAILNQVQKEVINGLGRGGNLPLGAVKTWTESIEKQDENTSDDTETGGRGSPSSSRGRGRRGGGGRNNYRKDRAMKKHFAGIGGGF